MKRLLGRFGEWFAVKVLSLDDMEDAYGRLLVGSVIALLFGCLACFLLGHEVGYRQGRADEVEFSRPYPSEARP